MDRLEGGHTAIKITTKKADSHFRQRRKQKKGNFDILVKFLIINLVCMCVRDGMFVYIRMGIFRFIRIHIKILWESIRRVI